MEDLCFLKINENFEPRMESLKSLCNTMLEKKLVRGDYKELVKLVLFAIGDDSQDLLRFNRPGAMHKARWMAKLLYALKMYMLSRKIHEELPRGSVFAAGQFDKLERFVQFIVCCYIPWWLTALGSTHAPVNDLALLQRL